MLAEGGNLAHRANEQQPTILIACCGREGRTQAKISPWVMQNVEILAEIHEPPPSTPHTDQPHQNRQERRLALTGSDTEESGRAPETSASTENDARWACANISAERKVFVAMTCHSIQASSHSTLGNLWAQQRVDVERMVEAVKGDQPNRGQLVAALMRTDNSLKEVLRSSGKLKEMLAMVMRQQALTELKGVPGFCVKCEEPLDSPSWLKLGAKASPQLCDPLVIPKQKPNLRLCEKCLSSPSGLTLP